MTGDHHDDSPAEDTVIDLRMRVRDTGSVTPHDPAREPVDIEALYLEHRDAMHGVAHTLLNGRADLAADVVQEVIEHLLRARRNGTLTQKDNWQAYLVGAVRNIAHRVGGDAARLDAATTSRDASTEDGEGSADATAEHHLDRVVDDQLLAAGLARLTARRRFIIWKRVVEQATREEIAQTLGVSPQAVGQNEHHALEQLRKEWADDDRPS